MKIAIAVVCAIAAGLAGCSLFGNNERVVSRGSFHSVAHKGSGEARVVVDAGGRHILKLLRVKTYPSAELEVCLVAAPDAEDNDTVLRSGFACVGEFRTKAELLAYPLPPWFQPRLHRAVTIWNRGFGVNFTTAPLE
jgi:hypothetical protein